MSKLYVFGIGGTGARVIKSLAFLLASGVKLNSTIDTVVPVIIDPDQGNGDLTRTKQLLDLYIKINKKASDANGFFSTSIKTLPELIDNRNHTITDKFKMLELDGAQNERFYQFIDKQNLERPSNSLIELLFSEENLNAEMSVGFKGNPNIGSVVLNQFKNCAEYKLFLDSFKEGDSIFIVSSIFGGTGAAGFPLLLRNLRKVDSDLTNSNLVANSNIGALSMMPYFKVSSPAEGKVQTIDSSSFLGKAKAALSYYSTSIFQSKQLNAFYSIGEEASNFYEHNDGQIAQKNNAHFLELASAIAIVDFTNHLNSFNTKNNLATETVFKEFGVKKPESRKLNFKSLGDETRNTIQIPMSKFFLMTKLNEFIKSKPGDFERSPWYIALNEVYSNDGIYNLQVKEFERSFMDWLDEMDNNDISFEPFFKNVNYDQLLSFIDGYNVKKPIWKFWSNEDHGDKFNENLNKEFRGLKRTDDKASDYLSLFHLATTKQIKSLIN